MTQRLETLLNREKVFTEKISFMRRRQKSIKEKLDLDSIKVQATPIINKKEILKHPISKVIITGVAIYGFIYVSKHFVNAFTGLVKAVRNAQHNLKR